MTYKNQIINGDCLTVMRGLQKESVHCCVTSPPYYGLRDYGVDGQIGREETAEQYIGKLITVFSELKRVLRPNGTLWLNISDCYCAAGKKEKTCKPKDLIGIPWRLALALRADGWHLRSDIIWTKENSMPENVKDRPTRSYEHVFLLTKSKNYYYDYLAIAEPIKESSRNRYQYGRNTQTKYGVIPIPGQKNLQGINQPQKGGKDANKIIPVRNKRDVWTINTVPYKGAHFATFPPKLVETCILAGCPERGIVIDPFFGSGTTGAVAKSLNRFFIGIELNPEYCRLAQERVK